MRRRREFEHGGPDKAQRESSQRIEEIRDACKQIFQQESVLRADRCCEPVGF